MIRVSWGMPGVVESARLVPEFSRDVIEFLRNEGLEVSAPDFDKRHESSVKDPAWLLPILEISKDVSVSLIAEMLIRLITEKKPKSAPSERIRILLRMETKQGVQEVRVEGSPDDVVESLKHLDLKDDD